MHLLHGMYIMPIQCFLAKDWDERIRYLQELKSNEHRKAFMKHISHEAELYADDLTVENAEDLHEFVTWLVTGK